MIPYHDDIHKQQAISSISCGSTIWTSNTIIEQSTWLHTNFNNLPGIYRNGMPINSISLQQRGMEMTTLMNDGDIHSIDELERIWMMNEWEMMLKKPNPEWKYTSLTYVQPEEGNKEVNSEGVKGVHAGASWYHIDHLRKKPR